MLRLGWVEVVGTSMEPTLHAGDLVLVRWGGRPRAGRVVVARWPQRPDVLTVKRVYAVTAAGVDLRGDAPAASDDSRTLGLLAPAAVLGTVVPLVRRRRG